jgi:hypothetical protein
LSKTNKFNSGGEKQKNYEKTLIELSVFSVIFSTAAGQQNPNIKTIIVTF